jgi:hypothetical protein
MRYSRRRLSRMLVGALLFALVACGGPGGPGGGGPDQFFENRDAYGDDYPEDALILTPEEFKDIAQQEGFIWDSIAQQEVLRREADERFRVNVAVIQQLVSENPELDWLLEEPDLSEPDIELLPNGDYMITVLDTNGNPFQVRVLGQSARFQDYLVTREQYQDAENQRIIYTYIYEELPDFLKEDLPTLESLAAADTETILQARSELEARLSANTEALSLLAEQHYLAAMSDTLQLQPGFMLQTNDALIPPGYPQSPADEIGADKGLDRGGTCAFSPFGLYRNFWWPTKYYQTSVKWQGGRGSCVAFALTSALEGNIALQNKQWLNLSEQYLYYKIKSEWAPADYGDGATTHEMAKKFGESNYRLTFESQWNYNKSLDRMDLGEKLGYGLSCLNYNEYCSNTSHQGQYYCTTVAGVKFCGYKAPAKSASDGYRMPKANVIWQRGAPLSGNVPYFSAWLYTMTGYQVVVALDIDSSFDNPREGFVSHLAWKKRGGHAVHVVGFIPASFVASSNLPNWVKSRAENSGGGFFIIKNSWGCSAGDGGYYYVPVAWAEKRFKSMTIVERGPKPPVADTPPTISISSPKNNASFQVSPLLSITFSAEVSDADDGPACCEVRWTSSVEGNLGQGKQITRNFGGANPGPRTITATAKDSKGHETSASITINLTTSAPNVSIVYPIGGEYYRGLEYTFVAEEFSGPNASQPCSAFTWRSTATGEGPWSGCTPMVSFATTGPRTITVSLTNQYGQTGSDKVDITVVEPPDDGPPVVNITSPEIQAVFTSGQRAYVAYSVVDPSPEPPTSVEWSISYGQGGTQIPITLITDPRPTPFRPSNRYFRPSDYVTPLCFHNTNPSLQPYVLRMVYTNSEGRSATARVPIYLNQKPDTCIN